MPGLDLGLARGDLALARLEHLAHDDVLDLLGLDPRALERGLDGDAAELGRGQGATRPPPSLPTGVRAALRITVLGMAEHSSIRALRMDVRATTDAPAGTGADTIAVGALRGRGDRARPPDGALQALVDAGEAQRRLPQARPHARRRQALAPRRARQARRVRPRARPGRRRRRARPRARARRARRCAGSSPTTSPTRTPRRSSRAPCWRAYDFTRVQEPATTRRRAAARRADRLRPPRRRRRGRARPRRRPRRSTLARDLQNRPANDLTPTRARRARARDRRQPRRAHARGRGPRGDRGGRAWAPSPASRRAPTRSRR